LRFLNRPADFFITTNTFSYFNYFAIGWIVQKENAVEPQKTTISPLPRGGAISIITVPSKNALVSTVREIKVAFFFRGQSKNGCVRHAQALCTKVE
jgi:hypothetical protein